MHSVFVPPNIMISQPVAWLHAISKQKGEILAHCMYDKVCKNQLCPCARQLALFHHNSHFGFVNSTKAVPHVLNLSRIFKVYRIK